MKRVSSRGLLFVGAMVIAAGPALSGTIDPRQGHLMLYWLIPLCAVPDAGRESRFVQISTLVTVALLAVLSTIGLVDGEEFVLQDRGGSLALLLLPQVLAAALALAVVKSRDLEAGAHWARMWMGFHLFVVAVAAGLTPYAREAATAWTLVFGAALVMAGEWLTRTENPPPEEDPAAD